MTEFDEADYYRRRAETHRRQAEAAAGTVAAETHANFARAYDERARALSSGTIDETPIQSASVDAATGSG